VSCPPTQTVAANTWRNTRIVFQPTVSTDTANQLSATFLSRPRRLARMGRTRCSLGRSMAAAGSDADMAIERCSGESGLAATLRI